MVINITENAAEAIAQYQIKHQSEGKLRVKVIGGGCSGLRYDLGFDLKFSTQDDILIEEHGIGVVTDERSSLYLMGCTLDYVDGLMETGFKIVNPNAQVTCGCGESFGVA